MNCDYTVTLFANSVMCRTFIKLIENFKVNQFKTDLFINYEPLKQGKIKSGRLLTHLIITV